MASSTATIPMRQLRLAVVCDGGVSLAIYMHGVTKEMHKLLRASRAFDAAYEADPAGVGGAPNPFDAGADSERAYFEELRDLAVTGRPVSVVIDIVSGTSAGGINGVCLAKVIAGGGSQDRLRELWMTNGDLRRLLIAPRTGWLWPQVIASAAGVLAGLLRRGGARYPLRGDRMSRWLFDAIEAMNGAHGATLVPEGNSVDLFVTATDLHGFDVLVPAGGGGPSQHALDHRQVLSFRYQPGGVDDFTGTAALAFAARATSAFPGAFPPVSIDSFTQELAGDGRARPVDTQAVTQRLTWQHPDPQHTLAAACADGGVLDNQPFDLAIKAIGAKRAETQVIRRLIYIDPNPDGPLTPPVERNGAAHAVPGLLGELKTALVNARGDQPVLRDLIDLRDINLRIRQVGEITTQQMDDVLVAVRATGMGTPSQLDRDRVRALTAAMHDQAATRLGPTYPTYCRLKLGAAADALADQVEVLFAYPPGSNRSSFARAAIHAWCQAQPGWHTADHEALVKLLDRIDVPYRIRRLKFILTGVNTLYDVAHDTPGAPTVAQLNALKREAWNLLDGIGAQTARTMTALKDTAATFLGAASLTDEEILTDPQVFADTFATQIGAMVDAYGAGMAPTFEETLTRMWSAFTEYTRDWHDDTGAGVDHRDELLSRYVAFPLWDALIFPTIALAPVPQFNTITVTRFSPRDADHLTGVQQPKLKGTAVHHFGGFLKAEYRENDYLWGRLDGAELCLRTLRGTALGLPSGDPDAHGPHLNQALAAIVAAERGLPHIGALRDKVARHLEAGPTV